MDPLHWKMAVAECLETFPNWLPFGNFDNDEWIWWHLVELYLKKSASTILEARKKGSRGDKRPVTDWGEHVCQEPRINLSELPNTMFWVLICWVSNGKEIVLAPKQLNA